ncbi:MAG: DUF4139 domain-containing protein [Spirochaetota bacterium]
MKKLIPALILFAVIISVEFIYSEPLTVSSAIAVGSAISSVKLFTNRAEIARTSNLNLKKGMNTIIIDGLPDNLYDWSVKGTLPEKFDGKIMSIEISKTALIEKKQKNILVIEKKLEELKELDSELIDELANIKQQENFLDSVTKFTEQEASKELSTRLPQTTVWNNTMDYISAKKKNIMTSKRSVHKKRKELAKKIQSLEFDLYQIAGKNYYNSYMKLNKAIEQNTALIETQQYGELSEQYEIQQKSLMESQSGIDTEKRLMLTIFSSEDSTTDFSLTYIIPDTFWNMKYDFRANRNKNEIEVIVYSEIYQKTGEDWENVNLSLSTLTPVSNINIPQAPSWYIDVREEFPKVRSSASIKGLGAPASAKMDSAPVPARKPAPIPEAEITSKGLSMEIAFPVKQTIESSKSYQKKYLKSYTVKTGKSLDFFLQTVPQMSSNSYLIANIINSTELPWLAGEAQIFLENEFVGKLNLPDTPINMNNELVLGIDPSVKSKKELVNKYEDKTGIFGGNRKIIYTYKITVENSTKDNKKITVIDNIPVSRNSEIKVEIEQSSLKPLDDAETKKSTDYARGVRKYILNMEPESKKEITYNAVIIFDKDLNITGLK